MSLMEKDLYRMDIMQRAFQAQDKAEARFPQPNYVALKVAEEAGELVKAAVHYAEGRDTWENVEAEAVQAIAMCLRLLCEGDQRNGITPPHLKEADRPSEPLRGSDGASAHRSEGPK